MRWWKRNLSDGGARTGIWVPDPNTSLDKGAKVFNNAKQELDV